MKVGPFVKGKGIFRLCEGKVCSQSERFEHDFWVGLVILQAGYLMRFIPILIGNQIKELPVVLPFSIFSGNLKALISFFALPSTPPPLNFRLDYVVPANLLVSNPKGQRTASEKSCFRIDSCVLAS